MTQQSDIEFLFTLSVEHYAKGHNFAYTPSEEISVKHFDSMSIEWLEFIKQNRSKGGLQHNFDVVIGPVADDKTVQTVQLYLPGTITADEAINRLRYNKVNNQISFHTEKALQYIKFIKRVRMNDIFFYNGEDVTMNVCLSVLEVTRIIAKKNEVPFDEAAVLFSKSKTCDKLHDSENGLWTESPEYIASMFYDEQISA